MQIPTTIHRMQVRNPYGRVRENIEGTEGYGNPSRRQTVSTNLNTWKLQESEPASNALPCLALVGVSLCLTLQRLMCHGRGIPRRPTLSEAKGKDYGGKTLAGGAGQRAVLRM